MIIRRLEEVVEMDCRLIHVEIAGVAPGTSHQPLDNMVRLGFARIYDQACVARGADQNNSIVVARSLRA